MIDSGYVTEAVNAYFGAYQAALASKPAVPQKSANTTVIDFAKIKELSNLSAKANRTEKEEERLRELEGVRIALYGSNKPK